MEFYVARFAPPLVGKLLLLYLSEIRPFRADQQVFPEHFFSPLHENLIWEEKGKPWSPKSNTESFKEPTLKHLGAVGLSSKICRPMMAAIGKNVRDTGIPTFTLDSPEAHNRGDAWELQAGHSTTTGLLHYSIHKDTCLQVSTALFEGFFQVSLMLQKNFFGFDGNMLKGSTSSLDIRLIRNPWNLSLTKTSNFIFPCSLHLQTKFSSRTLQFTQR